MHNALLIRLRNQILDLLTQHVCTTLHCYFQLRPLIPQYIQVAVDSNSPLSLHKCKRMSYLKEHLQYGQLTMVTDKKKCIFINLSKAITVEGSVLDWGGA